MLSNFILMIYRFINRKHVQTALLHDIYLFGLLISATFACVFIVKDGLQIFPEFLKNIASLLFGALIITIPPTIYNIGVCSFNLSTQKHTKIYFIAYTLALINFIAFLYLNSEKKENDFLFEVTENVMNYANFSAYIFIFPTIAVIYTIKTFQLFWKEKQNNVNNRKFVIQLQVVYVLLMLFFFLTGDSALGKIATPIFIALAISFLVFLNIVVKKLHRSAYQSNNDENLDNNQVVYFNEIAQKLEQVIEEQKPYLDPKLTIFQFAKLLDTNEKYLSHYLNTVHEMNFMSFINHYRIETAKRLLTDPLNDHFTIETIANMAGFHSKSSFNTLFKKTTSSTPSEYKKLNLKQEK